MNDLAYLAGIVWETNGEIICKGPGRCLLLVFIPWSTGSSRKRGSEIRLNNWLRSPDFVRHREQNGTMRLVPHLSTFADKSDPLNLSCSFMLLQERVGWAAKGQYGMGPVLKEFHSLKLYGGKLYVKNGCSRRMKEKPNSQSAFLWMKACHLAGKLDCFCVCPCDWLC